MNEYYLEVRNISKSFVGVQALKKVNLKIRPGETHCLAGENGCGKSTLIKVISGFYTADEGEIIINGKSYARLTPRESMNLGIQVIYQDFSLFNNLTVAENIAMSYNVSNSYKTSNKKRDRELAQKVLNTIGIDLDVNTEVGRLSVAQNNLRLKYAPKTILHTKRLKYHQCPRQDFRSCTTDTFRMLQSLLPPTQSY